MPLLAVPHDVSVRRIGLSTDQLSLGADRNIRKLRDKAYARQAIFRHAVIAGIDVECSDMIHFFNGVLVLSRQCAISGLDKDAADLYALVNLNSAFYFRGNVTFRLYGFMSHLFGWRIAALVINALSWLVHPLRKERSH